MIAIVVLTFLAVFLLVSSLFLGMNTIRESPSLALKKRLRNMALEKGVSPLSDDLRSEILKEQTPLERLLRYIPGLKRLDWHLDHAGLEISVGTFLLIVLLAAMFAFVAALILTKTYLFAFFASAIIVLAAAIFVNFKKKQRVEKFTEQMPEVLSMISRSLRAGHSMTSAVELVGSEMANPAGELFKIAYEQQKLGLSITDTIANMTNRIESLDLRFFITTIAINSDVGGNLAEILDKLAETIMERLKIKRQVRVYTAQGRMSGYTLAVLPIFAFIMINAIMPNYTKLLLTEKFGHYMLLAAAVAQIIGFFFIRRIINIRI